MNQNSENEIKSVLSQWVESTRFDKKDHILAHHLSNAVIFDVLAPLKYQTTAAYRDNFNRWQPPFEIPCLFELSELSIKAEADIGFAHCLIHCGGTLPDG